jgi:Zn-dependent membrane protease YugP
VSDAERSGASKVLRAAALTYVAAALAALTQLAYYALIFLGNRN